MIFADLFQNSIAMRIFYRLMVNICLMRILLSPRLPQLKADAPLSLNREMHIDTVPALIVFTFWIIALDHRFHLI